MWLCLMELEVEVKAEYPLSHRNAFEEMPATAKFEIQGLPCPSLALLFFLPTQFSLPLFLMSCKYLHKSQDVETSWGFRGVTWYTVYRRRCSATTHMHADFHLGSDTVTAWRRHKKKHFQMSWFPSTCQFSLAISGPRQQKSPCFSHISSIPGSIIRKTN